MRMRRRSIQLSTCSRSARRLKKPKRATRAQLDRVTLPRTGMPSTRPCILRSTGTMPTPACTARRAAVDEDDLAGDTDLTALGLLGAEDGAGQRHVAGAQQPENADDLARAH